MTKMISFIVKHILELFLNLDLKPIDHLFRANFLLTIKHEDELWK